MSGNTLGSRNRRSSRVPFASRVVISGQDTQGVAFRADGEIVEVSLHGARIRTAQTLRVGMKLRIFSPAKRRSCAATVVWCAPGGDDSGVQLDADRNFWGLQFSAERRHRPDQASHGATVSFAEAPASSDIEPRPRSAIDPQPCDVHPRARTIPDHPASSEPLRIPAEGVEVTVNGISLCHAPFQERTLFVPDGDVETEAILWLKPLLRTGAHLRVVFADRRRIMVSVTSTLDNGIGDTRLVRVTLRDGIRVIPAAT